MTLSELRYIVAVARERHFGRAADACFVSQPTLSVAVKKLEGELGVSLFERGHGEVSLTPAGELVVAQAQRVLEEAGAIKEIARQGQDQLSGPLRLGAIYTIARTCCPPDSADGRALGQMPLVIEENYTASLSERLRRGDLEPSSSPAVRRARRADAAGLRGALRRPAAGVAPLGGKEEIEVSDLRGRTSCCWAPGTAFAIRSWRSVRSACRRSRRESGLPAR